MRLFGKTEVPDYETGETILERWALLSTKWFGIKIHKIIKSDNPLRGLHDHPWSFLSIQLRGKYDEWVPSRYGDIGIVRRAHKFINVKKATDLHRVELVKIPCWTLVINGPRKREWGFRKNGRWLPHYEAGGHETRRYGGIGTREY